MIVLESGTLRIIYVFAIVLRQTTTGPEGGWQGMAQNGPMLDRTPIILTLEGCACSMRVVVSGYLKPLCRSTVTATMKEHDTHTHENSSSLGQWEGSDFVRFWHGNREGHKTWAKYTISHMCTHYLAKCRFVALDHLYYTLLPVWKGIPTIHHTLHSFILSTKLPCLKCFPVLPSWMTQTWPGFDFGTKHFSTVSHAMVTLLPLCGETPWCKSLHGFKGKCHGNML